MVILGCFVRHVTPEMGQFGHQILTQDTSLESEPDKRLQLLPVAVPLLPPILGRAAAAGRILCSAGGILLGYTFLQLDSWKSCRLRLRPIIQGLYSGCME